MVVFSEEEKRMENLTSKARSRLFSELSCHLQVKDVHSFLGIEDGEEALGQGKKL